MSRPGFYRFEWVPILTELNETAEMYALRNPNWITAEEVAYLLAVLRERRAKSTEKEGSDEEV